MAVTLVGNLKQFRDINPGVNLWVAFGMGRNFSLISINSIGDFLGEARSVSLPVFYALTGCETTSTFYGKAKKSAWQAWVQYPNVTPTFKFLANNPFHQLTVDSCHFQQIERFAVIMYDFDKIILDKIILGDFNIDYSSKKGSNANQSDRRKLKGIADLHDMKQIINLPTRIAEHSESQIDLIFTDNVHKIIDFGVKDFGISDHSMVYCVFKSGLMKVPPKTLEYRSFKSYYKSAFRQDLKNVPWQVALNNPEDLEGCVQTWNKLFTQFAEDHAPTKTRRVRGTLTPWMTSEIATLMRDRNYHLKEAKGNKTNFHWKQYRALRNKVQRKIKSQNRSITATLLKTLETTLVIYGNLLKRQYREAIHAKII